jgi:hypothetical protein
MLVPEHWAEAQATQRAAGRQVTVRRFGWSMESEAAALGMARARVAEALARIAGGSDEPRREPKVPYNGAEGVPIREEVVQRFGADVVTRNSYGARCLNTPDVWIADVDFDDDVPLALVAAVAVLIAGLVGLFAFELSGPRAAFYAAAFVLLCSGLVARALRAWARLLLGDGERRARRRLANFVKAHPDWRLRVHRTPNGLRLVALQRPFAPNEPASRAAFEALGVDPVYATMCERQGCFRARLDAKPWRIGVASHLKPRPGVWPVSPQRRAGRAAWLAAYDAAARGFAACRFEEELGDGAVDPRARAVSELHDALSGTTSGRPIA